MLSVMLDELTVSSFRPAPGVEGIGESGSRDMETVF